MLVLFEYLQHAAEAVVMGMSLNHGNISEKHFSLLL